MIGHVIDLTLSKQFHVIAHPEFDLSIIIYQLTYSTFLVNFLYLPFDQLTQSTFFINQPTIDSSILLAFCMLLF